MDNLYTMKEILEEALKISWVFNTEALQILHDHSETENDKAIYLAAIGMNSAVTQSQKRYADNMLLLHMRDIDYDRIPF